MANTRDLMNKVLIGLRQDQIGSSTTSTTDKYELLILQFLNEAKAEVEELHAWQALRSTVAITLAQGTSDYTVTSAGDADTDTDDRSVLLYEKGASGGETTSRGFGSRPQVFDVTDAGEYRLAEVSVEKMERLHLTDSDEQQKPSYFSIYNDGTSLKFKVWPTPSAARTINARIYIPEAELSSTDLTTTVTVPVRPIWTKALWKANEERGEEAGRPNGPNEVSYRDALAQALARELGAEDITSYPI